MPGKRNDTRNSESGSDVLNAGFGNADSLADTVNDGSGDDYLLADGFDVLGAASTLGDDTLSIDGREYDV